MGEFLLDHWGDLASLAGLVFSWMAFKRAGKARDAAIEARRTVNYRIFIDALKEVYQTAKEFQNFVGSGKFDLAHDRNRTLITDLQYKLAKWETLINQDSRNNIMNAIRHLELTERVLEPLCQQQGLDMPPDLSPTCQKVINILIKEVGRLEQNAALAEGNHG